MNKKQFSAFEFPSYGAPGLLIGVFKTLNKAKKGSAQLSAYDSKIEIYNDKALVSMRTYEVIGNKINYIWEDYE